MHNRTFFLVILVILLFLTACQPASISQPGAEHTHVDLADPAITITGTEEIQLSNCIGSEVRVETLGTLTPIRVKTTVGITANPGTDRAFELPLAVIFQLQDEVETAYASALEAEGTNVDQVELTVQPGSEMRYLIEWEQRIHQGGLRFDYRDKLENTATYELILRFPRIKNSQPIACEHTQPPAPSPIAVELTPTGTPTENPAATPTVTPTPQGPIQSTGSCQEEDPPCTYTIEYGDSFSWIARELYGSERHITVLLHYNRDRNGYRRQLKVGQDLFVPALSNLPGDLYPDCTKGIFPCLYTVKTGDTFSQIAEEFYKNPELARTIEHSNWAYDRVAGELTLAQLEPGVELVLPVPPEE